jgi:hypothetical protein
LFPPSEAVPTPRYKTGLGEWFRKVAVVRQTADYLAGRLTPAANSAPWLASGWLFAILVVLRNSIGNVYKTAATQLNNAPANPYP